MQEKVKVFTPKQLLNLLICLCSPLLFISCSSLTSLPDSQLKTDYYYFKQGKSKYEKVYVEVNDDSTTIVKAVDNSIIKNEGNQMFQKRSFDVDVLVVLFKIRPPASALPRQLTTDFNGNIFMGYRSDRYKSHYFKTPLGTVKKIRHRAFTVGTFGGLGTTSVSPWTTDNKTTDEYNGMVFSRGLSAMFGVNSITVGVGVGWDYLTDRDKDIWIYQNRPWFGLTLSLNLN